MESRSFSFIDRCLSEIDKAIKVLSVSPHSSRPAPAVPEGRPLEEAQRVESARLMRVNHCGEVAAQALYQGQALTAGDAGVSAAMRQAAAEETDHLAWCELRLRELRGRTSLLNPLWYAGSFAIGALAGAFGRGTNLGFVAETERQGGALFWGPMEPRGPAGPRSPAIFKMI